MRVPLWSCDPNQGGNICLIFLYFELITSISMLCTALKEPLKSKSPSFALELSVCKQSTDGTAQFLFLFFSLPCYVPDIIVLSFAPCNHYTL